MKQIRMVGAGFVGTDSIAFFPGLGNWVSALESYGKRKEELIRGIFPIGFDWK